MTNPRTTRLSSFSITSEDARDTRARAWSYVFDCYRKKEAATSPESRPIAAKGLTHDRAKTSIHK
jgi:hypothetical protein